MSEIRIKVVTLGSTAVGKTTLVTRWLEDRFESRFSPTISAGFQVQSIEYEGQCYSLQIWDTAGQDTYRDTTSVYCRDTRAAFIVFDLTDRRSFDDLPGWFDVLERSNPVSPPVVLVGNKSDLTHGGKREVGIDEAREFANARGAEYFETSAFTGMGVNDAFNQLVVCACETKRHEPTSEPVEAVHAQNGIDLSQDGQQTSGCC